MRRLSLLVLIVFGCGAYWLWSGGWDQLVFWAQGMQREVQGALARGLRALRAGEPGALTALLAACFTYGFAHAVGPGHGKLVIGGYGVARRVSALRLSAVAMISSLGQAVTAIALVYFGIWVLQASAASLSAAADDWLAPASYAAVALLGVWLVWRGVRGLRAQAMPIQTPTLVHAHALEDHHHDHGHDHHHHHHHHHEGECPTCGHSHAPSPDAVAQAKSLRELAALIGAVAIRPCTGAIFVLILGWRLDLQAAAIAGVVAMALGTGSVTIAVALAATGLRESAASSAGGWDRVARVVPVIEVAVGFLVAVLAFGLMQASL
ncbi:MAG: hypothetical protein QNJ03_08820 [Dinoroseobacter sp.]|nr:hypothetical protein [Dinoroseobacter sp.]